MAAQFNYPMAPVTQATHPFTYNCEFFVPENDTSGLITLEGFRNLLDAHIGTLNKAKQVSYTRNRAWLEAIRDGNTTPPAGYAGNQASWKNEIGATNPATSKWVVENGKVYKKDKKSENGRANAPMTPTEYLYDFMIAIHRRHGHKGRDNFFNLVKTESDSVKKAFCHQFVQVCCDKAEFWQDGNVPYGWQAPVKRRNGRERVDEIRAVDDMNAPVEMEDHASPQDIQMDNLQLGVDFEDINFDEFDAQIAALNNWNPGFQPIIRNYPTPPGSGGLGPRRGAPSYSPGGQTPVAAQGPVDGQYAVAGSQNIVDHQYPSPNQNAAVGPLQYEININNYMLNSPGFLQYPGDEHGQESQLLGVSNYDPNLADQIIQDAVYAPQVQNQALFDNYMILEQHNLPRFNNGMVLEQQHNPIVGNDIFINQYQVMDNNMLFEQHDSSMANNDMVFNEQGQMLFDNFIAVHPFQPQIPVAAGAHSMPSAQNEPEALPSYMNLTDVEDDNFLGGNNFNSNDYPDDAQMTL